jgi:hypothetical protein
MSTALQKVLSKVRLDPELGPADHEHLTRWTSNGDDLPWKKIEADAKAFGIIPSGSARETVIRYSLMTRRIAEDAGRAKDPILQERKQQRDLLLTLAENADALAKYFTDVEKFSGIAMFFARFLRPVAELQDFHRKEAALLRQRAGKEPTPTTFISRQRGGKKRLNSRKYNAFMYLMAEQMTEICGKPHYSAVSDITNIAFLKAAVTADDVRNACRAPRRRSRSTRISK